VTLGVARIRAQCLLLRNWGFSNLCCFHYAPGLLGFVYSALTPIRLLEFVYSALTPIRLLEFVLFSLCPWVARSRVQCPLRPMDS
jgi:hypothetical protein